MSNKQRSTEQGLSLDLSLSIEIRGEPGGINDDRCTKVGDV